MKNYKIEIILDKENLAVLTDSLKGYKGKKRLVSECILAIIKRQIEIQDKEGKEE